jgi:hypothetical protein
MMHDPLAIIVASLATWLALFAAVAASPAKPPYERKY